MLQHLLAFGQQLRCNGLHGEICEETESSSALMSPTHVDSVVCVRQAEMKAMSCRTIALESKEREARGAACALQHARRAGMRALEIFLRAQVR